MQYVLGGEVGTRTPPGSAVAEVGDEWDAQGGAQASAGGYYETTRHLTSASDVRCLTSA